VAIALRSLPYGGLAGLRSEKWSPMHSLHFCSNRFKEKSLWECARENEIRHGNVFWECRENEWTV